MTRRIDDSRNLALAHAIGERQLLLERFRDYLRIPSVSTDPTHRDDIERAAMWLAQELGRCGLEHVAIMATRGHPVVYADWLHAHGAPTILIYGHYDVQPVDPLHLWHHPPFSAILEGDRVHARGASDNKGQHFSHIAAIGSIMSATGVLPINVKLFLDGEEEIGSPSLIPFVKEHHRLLEADAIVVSDGPMAREGQPSLEYALRGIVDFEIHVAGPARDLHSGNYGGSVHNPAKALVEILGALHDGAGRIAVPGFYDNVLPLSTEEREILADVGFDESQLCDETGTPSAWGEPEYSILERITARPTLEINGMWSGYTGPGMKTIIPHEASAKLSARLVAAQNPTRIIKLVEEYVRSLAPATVRVTIEHGAAAAAAVSPYDGPLVAAARQACRSVWRVDPLISRAGGTLPIIATFQGTLGAPFILMPFGLDDNRHSPNEFYSITHLYKGIDTAIFFYYELAESWDRSDGNDGQ